MAIFQVPTVLPNYRFVTQDYLANPPAVGTMEMHAIPHDAVADIVTLVGCEVVEAREYDCIGIENGKSIEFLVRRRPSLVHSFRSHVSRLLGNTLAPR